MFNKVYIEVDIHSDKNVMCHMLINQVIQFEICLFSININIFYSLKSGIASAIPALNE